jgi:glycosyltransferase involved in cell wall biosynthesis
VLSDAIAEEPTPALTESEDRPQISIVIESFTPGEHASRGLAEQDPVATLDAVSEQSADWHAEIVVVTGPGSAESLGERLVGRPGVRVVASDSLTYYSQKNDAVRQTKGHFIAFIDGDCMPGPTWAAAAIGSLERGADAVTGPVDYPRGPFSRTMSYFDFGGAVDDGNGEATNLYANNVAFRRDVLLAYPFDTRLRRSGGCFLLTNRLKAGGRHLVFNRDMANVHGASYRRMGWLNHRMRNGHDAVNLRRFDDDGVLPYPWLSRLGLLGAPIIVVGRIQGDIVRTVRSRRDLGLSWKIVPWLWLASIPLRSLEGLAYALSSVRPDIIGRRWG